MGRLRLWPFAWGLGICAGAVLAVALGVYGPTWGAAAAFPAVALVLGFGAWKEDDGSEEITHFLRFTLGLTLGFLWATIPINLMHLMLVVNRAEPQIAPQIAARAAELRAELWPRWGVVSLAIPIGVSALLLRFRKMAKRRMV